MSKSVTILFFLFIFNSLVIFLAVNISSDNGAKSMSVRSVSKHVEWSVRRQHTVDVPMGGRLYMSNMRGFGFKEIAYCVRWDGEGASEHK